MLGSSEMKVVAYGPTRTTERPRVAECGKREELALDLPSTLGFKNLNFTSTPLWVAGSKRLRPPESDRLFSVCLNVCLRLSLRSFFYLCGLLESCGVIGLKML